SDSLGNVPQEVGVSIGRKPDRTGQNRTEPDRPDRRPNWSKTPDRGPDRNTFEDDDEELYRDVNINLEGRDVQITDVHTTQEYEDTHVTLTPVNPDDNSLGGCSSLDYSCTSYIDCITLTPPTIPTISQLPQAPTPPTTAPSTFLLRDEAQVENEEFLENLDENIQKIIKEQVKEQVKKILIEKMESNKSIQQSDEQRNLYKALVDAYESDKIILDTYGDTITLKRRRDDMDKDEEPSVRLDRGSKRRR
nr:hypothetical protein [Tanacetum cinerariifolium]